MEYLTAQELMQHINDYDFGLTKEDFIGVDIDCFIKSRGWTKENIKLFNIKTALEGYKRNIRIALKTEIMAKEIKCVDSTKEEFHTFVQMYFKEVDKQYQHIGTTDLIDTYLIVSDDARYYLNIGMTMNIDQYIIKIDKTDGICRIQRPLGNMIMNKPLYYNSDEKYFLYIDAGKNNDFSHWLAETFHHM